ncbi:retrovirus-related pol polyprotein from transposon TNT 1-94 [Tanacetum coccineum]
MQRPPLFESDSFIYWKIRLETYVKSKDLDLWYVITNGDFQPIQQNPETKLDEVIPFEKQSDDLKKRLTKNNEVKMVIYNAVPRKEYERIFMCNTAKEIWKTLLITHQDESIDSAFARFNTIITSLKALDEESKDLASLSLNELIGNLKVHEMIIKKDSEIVKAKVERKSLALKVKKESKAEDAAPRHSGSKYEAYVWRICLEVDLEPDEWIRDSGCSKHMTGSQNQFSSYKAYNRGYSQNSKAYIILSKHTRKIEESLNVTFDRTPPPSKTSPLVDDDLDEEEAIKVTEKKNLKNDIVDKTLEIDKIVNIKESKNHPLENVRGNLNQRTLRSQAQNQSKFFCFISTIEPKNVNETLTDDSWIVAMQEELNQFIANDVWELVPQPRNMTIIRTKWLFRNKLDENGIISQNKVRFVAQGYNQQEGIDYDETYAPVARLESIRILLAYACSLDFKLFQMDVKSAFQNGFINKEVYVAQPPGFIDFEKPDHVYKLKKALYGLKQAPKAWYDRLKAFLIKY